MDDPYKCMCALHCEQLKGNHYLLQMMLMFLRLTYVFDVAKQLYYIRWCELLDAAFRHLNISTVWLVYLL